MIANWLTVDQASTRFTSTAAIAQRAANTIVTHATTASTVRVAVGRGEDVVQAGDQEDAGGDHRGRVDQRADGARAGHRVRQPGVQRHLGGLADDTDEQQQGARGEGTGGDPVDGRSR